MLDDDEKRAFVLLAERLIEADGIVVGSEAAALAALKAEMAVGDVDEQETSIEELAYAFKSRRSRVAALLELFGLAHSDSNFHMSEVSLIASVAYFMGFDDEEIDVLESWVREYVSLVRKAFAIMRA
jgi:uncharacterized tellurite resistance protein B-like protein